MTETQGILLGLDQYQSQVLILQSLQLKVLQSFMDCDIALLPLWEDWIECDAANVISALNHEEVDLSIEGCIFDDIKELIPESEVIKWRRIPRTCNQVAHSIARMSLSFVEKRFWKEVGPPCIPYMVRRRYPSKMLIIDVRGWHYLRLP